MSLRNSYHRFDPCPCGSNLKAKKCCYIGPGTWFKRPAIVIPPGPITHITNDKCYASFTSNCNKKISREHYISESLLKIFELNGVVSIGGLPWIEKESMKRVSTNALASKILCERHNNALSDLDAVSCNFLKTIEKFDKGFNTQYPTNEFIIFSGEDIERWMLKTTLGMIASHQIISKDGIKCTNKIKSIYVDILFGIEPWPKSWGLYCNSLTTVHHYPSFSFQPKLHPETGEVLAAELAFNNFVFYLLLGTPDFPGAWGIYKPRTLIFKDKNRAEKIIEISWTNSEHQQYILFSRQGTYDGHAPNIPKWATH